MHLTGISTASKSTGGLTLLVISATLFLFVSNLDSTTARYLPTRADETDVEVLKNIIRGLLTRSAQSYGDLDQNLSQQQQQYERQFFHQHPRIERRSLEVPEMGANDSEDRAISPLKIKSDR